VERCLFPLPKTFVFFAFLLSPADHDFLNQVFSNKLTSGLIGKVPGLNPAIVLNTGATSIQHAIDPQFVADVLVVYNEALISAFYVATAMAALSLIGSLVMEWKSIKGKDIQVGGGA
jgi:hypothetical protein